MLIQVAQEYRVETGTQTRIDCTVTQSNIHAPTDSSLLFDTIRSLALVMNHAHSASVPLRYQDRTTTAKRLMLTIQQSRSDEQRQPLYQELLELTFQTLQEVLEADLLDVLPPLPRYFKWRCSSAMARSWARV